MLREPPASGEKLTGRRSLLPWKCCGETAVTSHASPPARVSSCASRRFRPTTYECAIEIRQRVAMRVDADVLQPAPQSFDRVSHVKACVVKRGRAFDELA